MEQECARIGVSALDVCILAMYGEVKTHLSDSLHTLNHWLSKVVASILIYESKLIFKYFTTQLTFNLHSFTCYDCMLKSK